MITAKNLSKIFGDIRAVDEVSFEIASGESIGLLGLNGAGKTTLLRIMSCLLTPSAGGMSVDGADVVEDSEKVRPRIGYLPEDPPLYGEMSVRSFLEFVARLRKVPDENVMDRVSEAIGKCQLDQVSEQIIETLSYGYRKRVGIAQAIVHKPPLVILDEPIAGLDPAQIVEMRDLVRSLRGEHTIVVSSHILGEISQTCDRIFVIHKGRIQVSGSEQELMSQLKRNWSFSLQVRAERDKIQNVLSAIRGIVDTNWFGKPIDGTENLQITAQEDIRAEVARALVRADLDLLEMTQKKDMLESIFLEVTGQKEEQP